MNEYEGMFIFPESIKEEQLDEVIARTRGEIEKLGGRVENTTRLGKRTFARPLHKQTTGHYVVFGFRLDGAQVAPLQERYKLMEEIFRVQIQRAAPAAAPAAPKPAEPAHG